MPLPTTHALLPDAQTSGHSPQPWTPTQSPIPRAKQIPLSYLYLSQIDFWPLILIPVNMIHEGSGAGLCSETLESAIKEPSVIYENYRGAPAGEGWAAWR